jgi:ADP-ribose pyrophosphatase YjhB (NUDIX family)
MTGREFILVNGERVEINVPVSGAENVMIPVVRIVVRRSGYPAAEAPILLQRRDEPGEPVRGMLEIPGGRWRSGESPAACAMREVAEEAGVVVSVVDGVVVDSSDRDGALAIARPLVVVSGIDGRFPATHLILTGAADGEPTDKPGATADARWWDITEVRHMVENEPEAFVPSSHAALAVYVEEFGLLA